MLGTVIEAATYHLSLLLGFYVDVRFTGERDKRERKRKRGHKGFKT